MNTISSTALAGLSRAFERFERSSQKLLDSTSGLSNDEPAEGVMGMIEAKHAVRANVAVIRAADDMTKQLLDITA